jgi:hypothetical protein
MIDLRCTACGRQPYRHDGITGGIKSKDPDGPPVCRGYTNTPEVMRLITNNEKE